MTTDPTNADDIDDADDGTIDIRPWKLIKKHGLKEGQPVRMDTDEVASFRDRFITTLGNYSAPPGTTAEPPEAFFEKHYKIRLDQLSDGYFERRAEGVELVFYGTNTDERTVWLVLVIGFNGSFSVSNPTDAPSEAGDVPEA